LERRIGLAERGAELATEGQRPGRVFAAFAGCLDSMAALLSGADDGAALESSAQRLSAIGLRLDAALIWAELAMMTGVDGLAREADRRARDGFSEMGAGGLLRLYERTLVTCG
jgi:hypothetical protein